MLNFIFIIQTGAEQARRVAAQLPAVLPHEMAAELLAGNWEGQHPGHKCAAAFCFEGDYVLEELEAMHFPPPVKNVVFLCRTSGEAGAPLQPMKLSALEKAG